MAPISTNHALRSMHYVTFGNAWWASNQDSHCLLPPCVLENLLYCVGTKYFCFYHSTDEFSILHGQKLIILYNSSSFYYVIVFHLGTPPNLRLITQIRKCYVTRKVSAHWCDEIFSEKMFTFKLTWHSGDDLIRQLIRSGTKRGPALLGRLGDHMANIILLIFLFSWWAAIHNEVLRSE